MSLLQFIAQNKYVAPVTQTWITGTQINDSDPYIITGSARFNSTYSYYRAFNGNTAETFGWLTPDATTQATWTIDFATTKKVVGIGIWANDPDYYNISTFVFAGSNDNSNFTTLYTRTDTANLPLSWTEFLFSNSTAYRYYRITVNKGTNYGTGMKEIKFLIEG